jgi:hypothetical protein
VATDEVFEPYRLLDADGFAVVPVAEFLRDLQACGRSTGTLRSHGMDLLRWLRFLWAVGVRWDRATAVEARDFCCWLQRVDKPTGVHWRYQDGAGTPTRASAGRRRGSARNGVTGKPAPGVKYAAATVAHCETVLRGFYEFHREAGSGPMVNPFPPARRRRANEHRNPMDAFRPERSGRFRPRLSNRVPRQIPDEMFDKLFAQLGSHRDRALLAFWPGVSEHGRDGRQRDRRPQQSCRSVVPQQTGAALHVGDTSSAEHGRDDAVHRGVVTQSGVRSHRPQEHVLVRRVGSLLALRVLCCTMPAVRDRQSMSPSRRLTMSHARRRVVTASNVMAASRAGIDGAAQACTT